MTNSDSTKRSLPELLKGITNSKIQLPDFQHGWVWDDDHVQSLLKKTRFSRKFEKISPCAMTWLSGIFFS